MIQTGQSSEFVSFFKWILSNIVQRWRYATWTNQTKNSVSDPQVFIDSGSGSSILGLYWSRSGSNPAIRIKGFDEQKWKKITTEKKIKYIIFIKNCNLHILSLGLQKGLPRYRRSLQPS
jgi:hypothetical protein